MAYANYNSSGQIVEVSFEITNHPYIEIDDTLAMEMMEGIVDISSYYVMSNEVIEIPPVEEFDHYENKLRKLGNEGNVRLHNNTLIYDNDIKASNPSITLYYVDSENINIVLDTIHVAEGVDIPMGNIYYVSDNPKVKLYAV